MPDKNGCTIFYAMLIPVILLAGSLTAASTFSRHMYSITKTDAAEVAEFDIEITAPVELDYASAENPYQHSFSDVGQAKAFAFSITNNKEVSVICAPHIDSNVQYRILVNDVACNSFVIGIGETVDFQVIIISDGLKTEAISAKLVLDIQQL